MINGIRSARYRHHGCGKAAATAYSTESIHFLTDDSVNSPANLSDWICSLACALSSTTRADSPIIVSTTSFLIMRMLRCLHSKLSRSNDIARGSMAYRPNRSDFIPNLEIAADIRVLISGGMTIRVPETPDTFSGSMMSSA